MTAELEATVAKLVIASEKLTTEVAENTKNVEKNTKSTNWRSGIFVVMAVTVAVVGYLWNQARLDSRNQGRCDVRAGYIDIANAAKIGPELTLDAIRNYDRRLADAGIPKCGGVSICEDGWYSQSTGRGACSSHGGVASILIPD